MRGVVLEGPTSSSRLARYRISFESFEAVSQLHELGVNLAMITGDVSQMAETVGAELGIDQVLTEVLPEDKRSRSPSSKSRARG